MWKSFCLASGIFACLVGIEMLLIDSAVVLPMHGGGGPQTFTAPDWAPWTLLSVGAVTVMHFVPLSGRGSNPPQQFHGR
jgi:hypothetical protein